MEIDRISSLVTEYVNTTRENIFLTGKAGTGKTTLLRHIVSNTFKKYAVAAPTGIAAINAGGVTLHSLLQLPFEGFIPTTGSYFSSSQYFHTPSSLFRRMRFSAKKRKLIQELDLLIIDEVSMLRADLLDCIDLVLQKLRRDRSPFGGLQLLFIGDLNQLPPVARHDEWQTLSKYYKSTHFFSSRVMEANPPVIITLEKVYRQTDPQFIRLLNAIRENTADHEDMALLNKCYEEVSDFEAFKGYIHITTHNKKAGRINEMALRNIESPVFKFKADISNDFPPSSYPADPELILKKGAQVMFIRNDPEFPPQFFNGKIGEVAEIGEENISVNCDGDLIEVPRFEWENKRYELNEEDEVEEKIIGTFRQYPLRLAWAITVHKSQGLTFEKAVLDLNSAFAPGQAYVALSRLTSFDGLVLSKPLDDLNLQYDEAIYAFTGKAHDYEMLKEGLNDCRKKYLIHSAGSTYSMAAILDSLREIRKALSEKKLMPQEVTDWLGLLTQHCFDLDDVCKKYIRKLNRLWQEFDDHPEILINENEKAREYFEQEMDKHIAAIKKQIADLTKLKSQKQNIKLLQELANNFFNVQEKIGRFQMVLKAIAGNSSINHNYKKDQARKQFEQTAVTKKSTREISFDLFKQGMTINQIARERGFVPGTIMGHLAHYVKQKEIPAEELVEGAKLQNIYKVIEIAGTTKPSEIKEKLGSEYEYGEIQIALAAHEEA